MFKFPVITLLALFVFLILNKELEDAFLMESFRKDFHKNHSTEFLGYQSHSNHNVISCNFLYFFLVRICDASKIVTK